MTDILDTQWQVSPLKAVDSLHRSGVVTNSLSYLLPSSWIALTVSFTEPKPLPTTPSTTTTTTSEYFILTQLPLSSTVHALLWWYLIFLKFALDIIPEGFNGIEVWRLSRPVNYNDIIIWKPSWGQPGGAFWVIVLLKISLPLFNIQLFKALHHSLIQNFTILVCIHLSLNFYKLSHTITCWEDSRALLTRVELLCSLADANSTAHLHSSTSGSLLLTKLLLSYVATD